jgi:hypothetical protein
LLANLFVSCALYQEQQHVRCVAAFFVTNEGTIENQEHFLPLFVISAAYALRDGLFAAFAVTSEVPLLYCAVLAPDSYSTVPSLESSELPTYR